MSETADPKDKLISVRAKYTSPFSQNIAALRKICLTIAYSVKQLSFS